MARAILGFGLVVIVFLLFITAFATIEPFKETMNEVRGTSSLNCPGTSGFNEVSYDAQTTFTKLVKRPTCFVTGMIMVYFIGAFLIAVLVWLVSNWRRIK